MKKIVLISVGQPSTNPRLVKEANALVNAGFEVFVIYTFWTKWAWETDKLLFSKVNWTPLLVGGSPFNDKLLYIFTRVRVKIFGIIAQKITLRLGIAEIAKGRTYPDLLKKAKSIKADLYIAHILAALPVAVKAAERNKAKCGFDAEDFHRHEINNDTHSFDFKINKYLENKYLPKLDYLTTSSSQITEAYHRLFPGIKPITIMNVFPTDQTIEKPIINEVGPIKLFWFSQTIGINRGLDNLMKALTLFKEQSFELHLLGNMSEGIENTLFQDGTTRIHFHQPIPSEELPIFSSKFDIGLALEPGFSINNDLALSNKIFTYLQGGLAIIASDTNAQLQFMEQYPFIGKIFQKGNPQSLADSLWYYHQHRDKLFEARKAALELAHEELNWEKESQKFLTQIKHTLSRN